jgi:hypothetical protein
VAYLGNSEVIDGGPTCSNQAPRCLGGETNSESTIMVRNLVRGRRIYQASFLTIFSVFTINLQIDSVYNQMVATSA